MAPNPNPQLEADASRLCQECGLCCSGAIFGRVELAEQDDPERIRKLGDFIVESEVGPQMPLPCKAFVTKCTIYEDRPHCCRMFECRLRVRVKEAFLPIKDALEVVEQTREMIDEIHRRLEEIGEHNRHWPLITRYLQVEEHGIEQLGEATFKREYKDLIEAVENFNEIRNELYWNDAEDR